MDKHLLVTISDDTSAHRGLKFVCGFFQNKEDIRLTLFNTAPLPPAVWGEETNFETLRQTEETAQNIIASSKRAMDCARSIFLSGGFASGQVDDKIVARNFSRIEDISREAESGLYDAVVFGRRGVLRLENLLDTSASQEMLETRFSFPVWLCREVDYDRRGVLLCVDDSDASRHMTDHVGFILRGETSHPVTLLRVVKKSGPAEAQAGMFSEAISLLEDNGFPTRLIQTRLEHSDDVAGAILREADRGRYAAVAVGRTSHRKGGLAQFFTNSVTMSLFRKLTGAALWVSR